MRGFWAVRFSAQTLGLVLFMIWYVFLQDVLPPWPKWAAFAFALLLIAGLLPLPKWARN